MYICKYIYIYVYTYIFDICIIYTYIYVLYIGLKKEKVNISELKVELFGNEPSLIFLALL